MSDDTERLTELEIKIAYLEKGYSDLSDVLHSLSNKLDLVVKKVGRIDALEAHLEDAPPADDKPPHY